MNSRPLPVCWRGRSPSKRRRGSVDMALNSVISAVALAPCNTALHGLCLSFALTWFTEI